jgi:large subunit ribosomal protein L18
MVKSSNEVKIRKRNRRRSAIRNRLRGTTARPRLVVFRSLKNIYAQIVDDEKGRTLCSASTITKDFKQEASKKKRTEVSFEIGQKLGEIALANGITQVSFDRSGYKYHGRVKALADGARKAGLVF